MGLEDWESATRQPALTISEADSRPSLGSPISASSSSRTDPRNPSREGSGYGTCCQVSGMARMSEVSPSWKGGLAIRTRSGRKRTPVRGASGQYYATPVRFVVACRAGHIEDFDWVWWAHRRRPEGRCANPTLYLRSSGKSAALGDLYIECRSCVHDGKPTSNSMGDALRPDSITNRPCSGWQPWLHTRQPVCLVQPRVIQRGASNVHFPAVASALSIPPVSEAVFQIVDQEWMVLGALPEEAVNPVLNSLANGYQVDVEVLKAAYRARKQIVDDAHRLTDLNTRVDEYAALSADRHDHMIAGISPHFENRVFPPPNGLDRWFDLIGAVSRLREVRALAGFSRIEPYPVSGERVRQAIEDGHLAPLSTRVRDWLPAAEIRGEGIFLRFATKAIDDWIRQTRNSRHVPQHSTSGRRRSRLNGDMCGTTKSRRVFFWSTRSLTRLSARFLSTVDIRPRQFASDCMFQNQVTLRSR